MYITTHSTEIPKINTYVLLRKITIGNLQEAVPCLTGKVRATEGPPVRHVQLAPVNTMYPLNDVTTGGLLHADTRSPFNSWVAGYTGTI